MPRFLAATFFALAPVLSLAGCGTVDNLHGPGATSSLYGGVQTDFAGVCGHDPRLTKAGPPSLPVETQIGGGMLALLDLPFSLVADTVTLPYIFYERSRTQAKAKPAIDVSAPVSKVAAAAKTEPAGDPSEQAQPATK